MESFIFQLPVAYPLAESHLCAKFPAKLPATFWPTYQTFPLADAIAFTENEIILIQITVSPRHTFKLADLQKLKDVIPAEFQQQRRWCLVYVAPDEDTATALRNRRHILANPEDRLDVFSSAFVPGAGMLSETKLEEILVGPAIICLAIRFGLMIHCRMLMIGKHWRNPARWRNLARWRNQARMEEMDCS